MLNVSGSQRCFNRRFGGSIQAVKVSTGHAAAAQERWGKHLSGGVFEFLGNGLLGRVHLKLANQH